MFHTCSHKPVPFRSRYLLPFLVLVDFIGFHWELGTEALPSLSDALDSSLTFPMRVTLITRISYSQDLVAQVNMIRGADIGYLLV